MPVENPSPQRAPGFRRASQADELAQLTQGDRLGDVPRVDVLQELPESILWSTVVCSTSNVFFVGL